MHRNPRTASPGLTLLGALSAQLALVAAVAADEPEQLYEEMQVTGTRAESLVTDIPAPIEIVTGDELRASGPGVLTDGLRGVAAVHLQATTPGQGSPFVRGLTGSSVLNLVDGMRLNHAIYRSAPNPYLSLVDPWLVDRIEVVRGPGSVLYGSDAMGGVIQVLTRRPTFDSREWDARGSLSTRFSSADLSGAVRTEVEGGRRGLAAAAGFSYLEANDLRGGGSTGRQEPTGYTSIGGDGRLDLEPADGHRTFLDFQILKQPETPRYDELVPGFGQDEAASDVFEFEPLERLFAHGRHEIDAPIEGIVERLRFDLAYQRIRDDRRTRDRGSVTEVRERNSSELVGITAEALSFAGDYVTLTWGAEAYLDRVESSRVTRDIETGTRTEQASRFPDGSRMDSYAGYLNTEIDAIPSLLVIAGLRYSYFDIDVAATAETDQSHIALDDLTGGIGFLWSAFDPLELALNLSRGFRAPNIFDLGTLGPRPGNRFNLPNTDLEPEEIYTVDVGLKLAGRRVGGALFGFFSYYDDKIGSVLTGDTTESGRDVVVSANLSEVRLAGIEAAGHWQLANTLRFTGNLAWTWGEEEAPDGSIQPADRIPPLLGRFGLRWDAHPQLWIEPYLRVAGKQDRLSDRDRRDPRIDPTGTDGWVTGNLLAGWTWDEHLSGTIALENFTDTSYREHGSGVQSAGINAVASLTASF